MFFYGDQIKFNAALFEEGNTELEPFGVDTECSLYYPGTFLYYYFLLRNKLTEEYREKTIKRIEDMNAWEEELYGKKKE